MVTENRLASPSLLASFSGMPSLLPEIGQQAGAFPVEQQLHPQPAAQPVVEPAGEFVEVQVVGVDLWTSAVGQRTGWVGVHRRAHRAVAAGSAVAVGMAGSAMAVG